MLRALLAAAACGAVSGWRAAPPRAALVRPPRGRRRRCLPTLLHAAAASTDDDGAEAVVREAARLLRDGHRDDTLIKASKQILTLVSYLAHALLTGRALFIHDSALQCAEAPP